MKLEDTATYPSLRDRVTLITGGGSGIGASIVERFCVQGSKVYFVDNDETASRNLVKNLTGRGENTPNFICCDVRNINELQSVIKSIVDSSGPIRILVNNAARDDRHSIEEVTPDYFDERIAVNMRHHFFTAQSVIPGMKSAGGGSIINMGSVSWMIGSVNMPIYLAAKSAIVGLTRALARELGPYNIRVNSILPGWIMTDRQKDLWLTPEGEAELMQRQCLKRKLEPDEIAKIVLFFSSDDSGICTNQNFVADGGWA
jgi:NAD(P)-dependent dehydrogenase (short-subunit alcohol dehydrogenase family)